MVEEDLAFGLHDEVACMQADLCEYLRRVSVINALFPPRQEDVSDSATAAA